MEVIGYADRPSVAPGEAIRFMVSCAAPSYEAQVVRLVHGDADPAGPGFKVEEATTPIDGEHPGRVQAIRHGSYVHVPDDPRLRIDGSLTIQAWIYPTRPGPVAQAIVARRLAPAGLGYALALDERGALELWLGAGPGRIERVATGVPMVPREWYFVAATYDASAGRVRLAQRPLRPFLLEAGAAAADVAVETVAVGDAGTALTIAAWDDPAGDGLCGHFNGKIDAPRLWSSALDSGALAKLEAGASPLEVEGASLVAAWDFSLGIDSARVSDVSGGELHGTAVNLPTRAVTGHAWTGEETDHRRAPAQYGAIHFHEDDLADAGWEPDLELAVPEGLRSGVYAVRLRAGSSEDYVPFVVRPARGRPTAEIAFLAPTLSYLAYANEHSSWDDPVSAYAGLGESREGMQPQDRAILDHRLLSIYDLHSDGSGVCYASWQRPLLSMRPGYDMPLIRAPHQLNGDLHLVDWLDTKGFRYDVVTDHDLHEEGVALLAPYRVVLTGNHPEYWTGHMLDALERYLADGGRLVYLGGNGFWWVTSIHPDRPDVLEVRRGHDGIRPWASAPGEVHHSGTGEPGGQWTYRGRPPEALVGVGFSGQGSDAALPYRRLDASDDPRAAFVFEGVGPDEPIGAGGLVLGGAGGAEVDDADPALGTPPHALRLATVHGFSDAYLAERLGPLAGRPVFTPPTSADVRGDMVYFETPNGGAVFSTGSIAWCGSLSDDGYAGPVSRITENVLRRFSER